jgi:phage-related protein
LDDRPLEFWDLDEWRETVTPWPEAVKKAIGGNLRILQHGEMPASHCKTLQGFSIPLLELWHRSGQRVVCTVAYTDLVGLVHVLDAFMKDSKEGKKMRKSDAERIEKRAKALKHRMDDLKQSMAGSAAPGRKIVH